jgi:hypothetical protein
MGVIQAHKNKEGISEWSKWITGVSLFSASGCVSVLVAKGVGEKNIINIKLAIVFFLLTILIAWLIQLTVAMDAASDVEEETDIDFDATVASTVAREDDPPAGSLLNHSGRSRGISAVLKSLIVLEILVFAFSCFYLARWVWQFPSAAPPQPAIINTTKTTALPQ